MNIVLKVPKWKSFSFVLRARKVFRSREHICLINIETHGGFAYFEVSTSSVVAAVKLILLMPEGSSYAETKPFADWQKEALMA